MTTAANASSWSVLCRGENQQSGRIWPHAQVPLRFESCFAISCLAQGGEAGFRFRYWVEYKLPRTDDTERRLQGEAVRYSAKAFVHSHDELDTRSTGFIASLLKLPAIQEISGRFEASRIVESEDDSSGEDEVIPSDKNRLRTESGRSGSHSPSSHSSQDFVLQCLFAPLYRFPRGTPRFGASEKLPGEPQP